MRSLRIKPHYRGPSSKFGGFCPKNALIHGIGRIGYLRDMGKRTFKKYVSGIPRKELEQQLLNMYEKFPSVKRYYDFIFNPKEEVMVGEAKARIRNEYFPQRRKRPRARRSVAQKFIAHFRRLEMDPMWVAELMVFNLETAQAFEELKKVPATFYKSMLNSFEETLQYVLLNYLLPEFKERILKIYQKVHERNWLHAESFARAMDVAGLGSNLNQR